MDKEKKATKKRKEKTPVLVKVPSQGVLPTRITNSLVEMYGTPENQ